jgi:hypothetical protein
MSAGFRQANGQDCDSTLVTDPSDIPAPDWLTPKDIEPLHGSDRLGAGELTVSDFWTWAFSDLRTNIVRGVLAEFLVAKAVGDPSPLRQAWDNFDVTTPSGIRVEVKSSAYLQSWRQREHSRILFTGLTGREWSDQTNELAEERTLRADVHVFATHTCRDPEQYDALDLRFWEFQVIGRRELERHGLRSVSRVPGQARQGVPAGRAQRRDRACARRGRPGSGRTAVMRQRDRPRDLAGIEPGPTAGGHRRLAAVVHGFDNVVGGVRLRGAPADLAG